MYETVPIPTDGSPVADTAAAYGCTLRDQFDAELRARNPSMTTPVS